MSDTHWKNKSRIHGKNVENFVYRYVRCVYCESKFEYMSVNYPSIDMICKTCNQNYQIKGKCGISKSHPGACYKTTLKNKNLKIDYIFVYYTKTNKIIKIVHVKSENIHIIPRNPLSITARRAGWQGCTIKYTHYDIVDTIILAGFKNQDL